MKTHLLPTLMGFCLIALCMSITACGQRGDLVQPLPPIEQLSLPDNPDKSEEDDDHDHKH